MSFAKARRFHNSCSATLAPGHYDLKPLAVGPAYTVARPITRPKLGTTLRLVDKARLEFVVELGRGGLAAVH